MELAEKRMFTKKITDADDFVSLSSSAQALYLHLMMSADDDGFNNQIQMAMFKAHASVDDLTALLGKRFLIQFDNGVIVIKHWRMANALRKDRYTATAYQEELKMLKIKDNGAYTIEGDDMAVGCLTDSFQTNKISNAVKGASPNRKSDYETIVRWWNELKTLGITPIRTINDGKRKTHTKARLNQYGLKAFRECIDKIKQSDFLQGKNNRGWSIKYDWMILPSNFPKVLEGNYDNKSANGDLDIAALEAKYGTGKG